MRYYIIFLFIILGKIADGQVMLPAYQGVQAVKPVPLPTVTTTSITSITGVKANSGGTVTSQAGADVIARGACWSQSANPTVSSSTKTIDGAGSGTFISNVTGLSPGTTYYLRAYATNAGGTAYGSQVSFTTTALALGDSYQGGKIFYILMPGDNGYSSSVQHGLIRTDIRAYVRGSNWLTINDVLLPNDNSSNLFGYNDWRLPNIEEAEKICATGVLSDYSSVSSSTTSSDFPNETYFRIVSYNTTNGCRRSNFRKTDANPTIMLIRQF